MVEAKNTALKYTNCDIPAMLFFDELMHGNIFVLGKGGQKQIHEAYWNIINEYCELSGNKKMISWFQKQERISILHRQISDVTTLLNPVKYLCSTKQEFEAFIALLNALDKPKVKFDLSKGLDKEIERVERRVIGVLRNELKMISSEQEKAPEKLKKDFMQRLVWVQNVLGRNIDDNITLKKFIFEEKSAHDKINAQNKK